MEQTIEENNELKINNITLEKIILFNSASYSYFETNISNNLILEGNNNAGKTTILNTLQFLLLPENNLNSINTKFRFKPGKDKEAYSTEETYKYYFSDDNSYIIFEITNKFKTFCVLLHGSSRSRHEYKRVILDTEYNNIKNLFITDKNELIISEKKVLLTKLKEKLKSGYREVFKTDDIKKTFFLNNREEEYNLVPLKNIQNDTIDNYKVLLKSLYDVSSMSKDKKIALVADIVKSYQSKNKEKFINFDISELETEYKNLKNMKNKIELLENFKEEHTIIKGIFENFDIEKTILIDNICDIFLNIKEELINIDKDLQKANLTEEEFKKQITVLEQDLIGLQNKLAESKFEIKTTDIEYQEYLTDFNTIRPDNSNISNEDFIDKINNEGIVKAQEHWKAKIQIAKEELIRNEMDLESTLNEIEISLKLKTLQAFIKKAELELNNINEKISNHNNILENNTDFSDNEKLILQEVLSDKLRTFQFNLIDSFSTEDIKKFLSIFTVNEQKQVTFFGQLITSEFSKKQDILHILEIEKESIEKEIAINKNEEKRLSELYSNSLKKKNLKIELETKNKELNIDIKLFERKIEIYANFNKIKTVLSKNPILIANIKKIIVDIQNNIDKINNDKNKISANREDNKRSINQIFLEKKSTEDILENIGENPEIEKLLDNDLESYILDNDIIIKDTGMVDFKTEYKSIKTQINDIDKKQIQMKDIIQKMINNNLLNELNNDTLNTYNYNNQRIIINYLTDKYITLEQDTTDIQQNIRDIATSTNNSIDLLKQIKNDFLHFQRDINQKFKTIKISDLKGVVFNLVLNKKLIKLLDKFEGGINPNDLDYDSHIEEMNNYILSNTQNKNKIQIIDLIENIEYKILEKEETIDENGNKVAAVLIDAPQSNGTETMILMVFIATLLKSIYREGFNLKMPIIMDEIQNVDNGNITSLLHMMGNLNLIIVGATPEATPDLRLLFETVVTVDSKQAKKLLNPKRKYIVLNEQNPLFTNEIVEDNTSI